MYLTLEQTFLSRREIQMFGCAKIRNFEYFWNDIALPKNFIATQTFDRFYY